LERKRNDLFLFMVIVINHWIFGDSTVSQLKEIAVFCVCVGGGFSVLFCLIVDCLGFYHSITQTYLPVAIATGIAQLPVVNCIQFYSLDDTIGSVLQLKLLNYSGTFTSGCFNLFWCLVLAQLPFVVATELT